MVDHTRMPGIRRTAVISAVVVTVALTALGMWRGLNTLASVERDQTRAPSIAEAAGGAPAAEPEWRTVGVTARSCPLGSVVADNFSGRSIAADWEHHGTDIGAVLQSGMLRLGGPLDNDAYAALRYAGPVEVSPESAFVAVIRPSVRRGLGPYMVLSPVTPPGVTVTAAMLAAGVGWVGGQAPTIDRALNLGTGVTIERGLNRWTPTVGGAPTYADHADNVDTLLAIIPRPNAVYMLLQPRGTGAAPRLSYIGPPMREREVTLNLASSDEWSEYQSASWVKLACFGDFTWDPDTHSVVVDRFDRAGPDALARPDIGPDAWTRTGAWVVDGGRVQAEDDGLLVTDPATTGGWVSVTARHPTLGGGTSSLIFGYRDPDNYLAWELAAGIGRVVRVQDGARSVLHAQAFPAGSRDLHLSVARRGSEVQLWLDGASFTRANTPLVLDAARGGGVGLGCTDGGCVFDDFRVMPLVVAPPAGFDDVLASRMTRGDVVAADALTVPGGGRLTDRVMPGGRPWRVQGQAWEIGHDGLARVRGRSLATVEAGATDVEVAARLRITPGADVADQFPGVSARATDLNNRVWARFLWQEGSPEIEVWETLDGRAALLNAVNISGRFETNGEYELRLAVVGEEVFGYLGERLMVQGRMSPEAARLLRSGRVGLSQDGTGVGSTFRSFSVRALAGRP